MSYRLNVSRNHLKLNVYRIQRNTNYEINQLFMSKLKVKNNVLTIENILITILLGLQRINYNNVETI